MSSDVLASLRQWRLRSRVAASLDLIVAVAGFGMITVAAIDSLITWPSNTIWIRPAVLQHAMAFVLIPGWIWFLLGSAILYGRGRNRRELRRLGRRRIAGLVALAAFCLAVIIGGFVIGGDKGSLRVLPGPRYEVSTAGLDDAQWTTVTFSQYRSWEARFLREDALFTLFGLFMLIGGAVAGAQRRVTRTDES